MAGRIVPQDFYVYFHRKATTGEVFYVGKGCGKRAWDNSKRLKHWKNTVKKHGLIVEIVHHGLQEWAAFEIERELIAFYGRHDLGLGNLVNLSDGGEGPSNPSDQIRKLLADAQRGRVYSDEAREKMRAAKIGRKQSAEQIQKRVEGRARAAKDGRLKNKVGSKISHQETGFVFKSQMCALRWLRDFGVNAPSSGGLCEAIQNNRPYKGHKFSKLPPL